jgi:hypothetical protein
VPVLTPAVKRIIQIAALKIDFSSMKRIGGVDERFQFYNVEMVEVIGGEFWKPYKMMDSLPRLESTPEQKGKYWEMHQLLMDHPQSLGIISLKLRAREAGVVNKRFLDQPHERGIRMECSGRSERRPFTG